MYVASRHAATERQTGVQAQLAETRKRDKKGPASAPADQRRSMRDRLQDQDIQFIPAAFELDGATTSTWAAYFKNLSEIAHTRRGHDQAYFRELWRTALAMTLHKARARAIIRRAHSLGCETTAVTDDAVHGGLAEITATGGPCGSHRHGEPPILLSADATARPIYDGTCLYGGDGRSYAAAG